MCYSIINVSYYGNFLLNTEEEITVTPTVTYRWKGSIKIGPTGINCKYVD
jgi:hypothetical protein